MSVPGAMNKGVTAEVKAGKRSLAKADPRIFIETRVEVISAGEVGCAELHGLGQKRKEVDRGRESR